MLPMEPARALLILTWVALVAPGAGLAGGGSAIDNDGDGRYSLEELRLFYPALTMAAFERIDENSDGWVTPGEFRHGQDEGLFPGPEDGPEDGPDDGPEG
jgi:hypothetical protein